MAQLTGPTQVFNRDTLTVDSSQVMELGTRAYSDNSNEYIYLQGTTSVVANDWVVYDENFTTTRLTANEVGPVAIASTAILTGEYGWFLIKGIAQANTDTISADSSLYIDGTDGRVDDLGVSGDLVIGAYSMTASVSNVATVSITYPHVSNDIGGSSGGVTGPASSTDNAVVRWDGTTGGIIQDSGLIVPDATGTMRITTTNTSGSVTLGLNQPLTVDATATISAFGASLVDDATALAARTTLGVVIGTDVQAFDSQLSDIAALTPSASTFIAGDGVNFVSQTAAQARSSLLLGTSDSPLFTAVNIGATDATLARVGVGDISVEGNTIYRAGGTDVLVADGGTGASTFTATAVLLGGTTSTSPFQQVSGLGTSGHVLTSNGASAAPTWQAAVAGGGGASTADILNTWIDAADMSLPDANFAARAKYGTTWVFTVLDFDATTTEYAFYKLQIPRGAKAVSTTTVDVFWVGATGFAAATSSAVVWAVTHRPITATEAFDSNATPAQATATVVSQINANNNLGTGVIPVGVTGTAWTLSELMEIQIARLPANASDNFTADARLLGINVRIQG